MRQDETQILKSTKLTLTEPHNANNSLEPARENVSIEQVRFTGSPAFDLKQNYLVPHPDPITYVGPPSPEIDRAWEELTWGTILVILKS